MGSNLPKVRRVTAGERRLIRYLLVVVAVLLVVILGVLMTGILDTQPTSVEERNVALLERGLAQNPDNAEIRMQLAEAQYEIGRRGEALDNAAQAVQLAPTAALMNLRYGQLLLREERYEDAEKSFLAEIELPGAVNEPSANSLLAQTYRATGRLSDALVYMERAVLVAYQAADLRILYAEMLAEAGLNEDAITQFEEALRYLPNDPRAIEGLAKLGVTWEETATVDPHAGTPEAETP